MSVRATNFVRQLRGLDPTEKSVAYTLADHDNHRGGGSWPSMSTVASEAGLEKRETASRITKRLVEKGILLPHKPVTTKQGKPTVYRFNYDLETCDSPVTPTCDSTCDLPFPTCDSGPVENARPVTLEAQTCDSPVTQRVEGKRKKGKTEEEGEEAARSSDLALAEIANASASAGKVEILPSFGMLAAFQAIGMKPFGSTAARNLWTHVWQSRNRVDLHSEILEAFFDEAKRRGLKLEPKWYVLKHKIEECEIDRVWHKESIQERMSRKTQESLDEMFRDPNFIEGIESAIAQSHRTGRDADEILREHRSAKRA